MGLVHPQLPRHEGRSSASIDRTFCRRLPQRRMGCWRALGQELSLGNEDIDEASCLRRLFALAQWCVWRRNTAVEGGFEVHISYWRLNLGEAVDDEMSQL